MYPCSEFNTQCNEFCFADSEKLIDPSKTCSLTLIFRTDDADPVLGMEIEVTKIADTNEVAFFTWTSAFAFYSLTNVNYMKDQSEWKDLADTITGYVIADSIVPTAMQNSN